jgi:hypothetical protein
MTSSFFSPNSLTGGEVDAGVDVGEVVIMKKVWYCLSILVR